MYKFSWLLILFFAPFLLNAQTQTLLFSELEDDALLEAVQNNYLPDTVLSYGMARDTMFSKFYNNNNNLTCVYSGHTIFIDPNEDPTQAAFMGGAANGINTEHTYPRSKGAEDGNARSDMHHLFPTRTPVNSARGSFPFADIPDSDTEVWFINNTSQSNIPGAQQIDQYSESRNGAFEPREDHKGNVARAVFYFYTMYRNQANNADPSFFEQQRKTLLRWHQADPVDQKEYERTYQIAAYQYGKPNPFVIDTTLAYRIYCSGDVAICGLALPTNEVSFPSTTLGQNHPNPVTDQTVIPYELGEGGQVRLSIHNLLGQEISTLVDESQAAGKYEAEWEVDATLRGTGLIFYQLSVWDGAHWTRRVRKLIL